jgi:hypothetical protein
MPAYLKQAPVGIPGDITRTDETNVEPAMLVAASSVYAQKFGIPMKYVSGGIQQFNGGAEVPADFAGILVREVPSISGSVTAGFTDNIPNPEQVQGMAVRGYISVKCAAGTPARGAAVFVQIVANGGVAVGEFRATDDGANAIELTLTQASWASDGKDADGNAEIRIAR